MTLVCFSVEGQSLGDGNSCSSVRSGLFVIQMSYLLRILVSGSVKPCMAKQYSYWLYRDRDMSKQKTCQLVLQVLVSISLLNHVFS